MNEARFAGIGMTSARTRDRLVQRLRDQGITNLAVLDRIRNLPRHIFVDEALASRAYEDTALPIGFGQTISQPYIVARMSEALLEINRKGITILLVEQDVLTAFEIARHGLIIETGRVSMSGTTQSLSDNPAIRQAYLGI